VSNGRQRAPSPHIAFGRKGSVRLASHREIVCAKGAVEAHENLQKTFIRSGGACAVSGGGEVSTSEHIRNRKSGRLWRGHPATPNQNLLVFPPEGKHRATQADVLIELLRQARRAGRGLELPDIMAAGIAQRGARFNEIRGRGFQIENQLERAADGRVLSRYFLLHDPERDLK